jgi:glycosyltransferase involved in cell wall biosynthesis
MKQIYNNTVFIIPVYNEEKVIEAVINDVIKEFSHVVCVDDGSTDNSANKILSTSAHLVIHPINMGQGAALQTGIEYARTLPGIEYFVTFDADGQHRIEDVKEMLKTIQEYKVDIVLGSRFLGSVENITKLKRSVLKLAVKFSNITSGIKLTDTHNGLRVFNKKVANGMQITMNDMAHASEILEIIRENNYSYKEIPVKIVYSEYSMAKGQSVLNAINIAFDVLLRRFSK